MKYSKNILPFLYICFCILSCSASLEAETKEQAFTVFQINLWHEGTKIPDGYQAIVDVLDEVNADIVLLCEIKEGNKFISKFLKDLNQKGKYYYGETLDMPVGILSKYKLNHIEKRCIIPGNETRTMLKADITIAGHNITLYSCHLDHQHYQCYMPRGYDGRT